MLFLKSAEEEEDALAAAASAASERVLAPEEIWQSESASEGSVGWKSPRLGERCILLVEILLLNWI